MPLVGTALDAHAFAGQARELQFNSDIAAQLPSECGVYQSTFADKRAGLKCGPIGVLAEPLDGGSSIDMP